MDAELKGAAPEKARPKAWWERGYDWHGAGASVTCMLCGATIADARREADGKRYYEIHDEWHEALGVH
jgi:hypothetical protein